MYLSDEEDRAEADHSDLVGQGDGILRNKESKKRTPALLPQFV